jgi:hypothetical protein
MNKERKDKLEFVNSDKRTVWWVADIDKTKIKEAAAKITQSFSKTLNFPALSKDNLPNYIKRYLEYASTVYVCRCIKGPSANHHIIVYWSYPKNSKYGGAGVRQCDIHETLTLPGDDAAQFSASVSDETAKEFLKLTEKLQPENNQMVDRSWRLMIRDAIKEVK